ncbi:hypothetical protein F3Y22_tig00003715pilonHSYRG00130 [Hibiscus syriacus]|uniref:Uncharacterized protein n=1 Tax=Hibiscus syriacus TaxID=106335 RepID=A0A6A3CJA1_HIBSY|nr:hypothetical protein F3Y22_tig00003715pilonHSYRG00130 [Hibiscus syriacus]
METDYREHVVAELDCCVAFDVNAHSAPNMGFEGLKNMETAAFDVNAYSTANLCLDRQHGLKNMESDVVSEPLMELRQHMTRRMAWTTSTTVVVDRKSDGDRLRLGFRSSNLGVCEWNKLNWEGYPLLCNTRFELVDQ